MEGLLFLKDMLLFRVKKMYVFQVKCYVAHCPYSNAHSSGYAVSIFFLAGLGVAGSFDVTGS